MPNEKWRSSPTMNNMKIKIAAGIMLAILIKAFMSFAMWLGKEARDEEIIDETPRVPEDSPPSV